MPLDPQVRAILDQFEAAGFPPLHSLAPDDARAFVDSMPRIPGPDVAKVEDKKIDAQGHQVPVRVYTPDGAGPFPVLLWFHGGGWVLGSLDGADGVARHLSRGAGCVVVSVDYRLSPETKFPGALEDCYGATEWVVRNASGLNVDPARVAVGGDSAGGNLAASVSLMARDQSGPGLAFQLLVYPVTDRNFDTPSYLDNADGYLLTRDAMIWFWDHYLGKDEDANNLYASPLKAPDLSGLPPALVMTAEFDPLRDDGHAYAEGLERSGVTTGYTLYPGVIHGFFEMFGALDKADQALADASSALRRAFSE